jgi:hypothetical protein
MHYFILCWSPVILLTALAVGCRMPVLHLSWIGALFIFLLIVLFFNTFFQVAILSALDGVLTTLPLLLVVFAGIMLSTLRDLAPFIFMLLALFLVNIVPPLRELTARRLCITVLISQAKTGVKLPGRRCVASCASASLSPCGNGSCRLRKPAVF